MANMTEEIEKKIDAEVRQYKQIQRDYNKAMGQRQQLDGQLNENTGVKQELDLLKSGDEVFKLIGPVLIKQDLEEAKQNVSKRMEYISSELKRVEDLLTSLAKKQETHCESVEKFQQLVGQARFKGTLNQPKA